MTAVNTAWLVRYMSRAELTKIRRRRGLFWTALLLSIGAVAVYFGILEILHLVSPAGHGPAGGTKDLGRSVTIMTLIGGTGAILVGANAGAGDANGVFRDLVATGRSRVALFSARIPGALGMYLPMMVGAYALSAVVAVTLAGGTPTPSGSLLLQDGVVLVVAMVFDLVLALGLASLTVSKSGTIAILMAWQFIVQQLLLQISWFGRSREALPLAAIGRLLPHARGPLQSVPGESAAVAIVVLVAWTAVALAVGAYRTQKMDA